MLLIEFLSAKRIDPDKGLCVTFGTDHVSEKKGNLLSISVRSATQSSRTYFVKGADAASVQNFTEVPVSHYEKHNIHMDDAVRAIMDIADRHEFLVVYNHVFFRRWASGRVACLENMPYLDVVDYAKLLDKGEELFPEIANLRDMAGRMQDAVSGIKGYSMQKLVDRVLPEKVQISPFALENKAEELYRVYRELLYA
jgi:hypothetical protein